MLAHPAAGRGRRRQRWHLHRRAARHVGRGAHHLLRWFGSLAAVMILVALFGIWRLMQGPVELNWLAPYLETAFDRSGIGLKVAVSGVRFGLDRTTQQLDLRATGVRVSLPDGSPLASFPEMATSFALGSLLRGRLAPTAVIVERPVLHLVRDPSGAISAQIGSGDQAPPTLGPQMLENLAGPREADAPLGLLRELSIRGATVRVDDRRSGHAWEVEGVDLAVVRSAKGVRGDFSLAVPMGNSLPEVRAYYRYFADRQVLDLDMKIDGVRPDDIPPLIPELAALQHLDAPVSGTLRTRIDLAHHQAMGSRLNLAVGRGQLHSDWLPAGSVALEKGEVEVVYAPEASEARIEKAAFDLGGGTELVLDGAVDGLTSDLIATMPASAPRHLTAKFAAALKHVPLARLRELWPLAFNPGGRRWAFANIHSGVLDEAMLRGAIDLDPATHAAAILKAEGGLRYHDLTVSYFDGLPMAHNVSGTAKFVGDRLDFTPTSGHVKGLKVTGGLLQLTNLDSPTQWATIDLSLAGPLQDALEVIDAKPLHYAHAIGIDPAHIGGRTETKLHFKFPLLADLNLDAIDYGAKATISGAEIPKAALDRSLTDGNLSLDLTTAGARLRGTARFDGIPARIEANVPFHAKAGTRPVYKIALMLDDAAQHRLDLDFAPDRLRGPIAADVTYTVQGPGRGEATALLDLRGAAMAIPEAEWKKPADRPGSAKVVLDLANDQISRISQIEVKAPGLDGHFAAEMGADHKHIDAVTIQRLTVGNSEVSGTVSRRGDGWMAEIHALRVDAGPLLKEAASGTPAAPSSQPLAVSARVDRLVLGPQRELVKLTANLVRTNGLWQAGSIDGYFVNGHRLSLRFGENGSHRLSFRSDDFGATLQAFDIASGIVGGQLTVDGTFSQAGSQRTVQAHVEGQNYTLVHAPVMARILAFPSLTGFASMLSGTGLPFASMRGDFSFRGTRLTIERVLAFGEAIGVTAKGWIDLDRDWLDLQGTVAPAYMLNSIIGHLPVLGLLGGGSQGLFAANYRLTGASSEPQVMVNPLSALAPGILRELFDPIVGVGAAQPQPQ